MEDRFDLLFGELWEAHTAANKRESIQNSNLEYFSVY